MKKLFISIPMRGRSAHEIARSFNKMHTIAEFFTEESLALINPFDEDYIPKSDSEEMYRLGRDIQIMSDAAVYIGIDQTFDFPPCKMENKIAEEFGIRQIFYVNPEYVMRDFLEVSSGDMPLPFDKYERR